MAKNRHKHSKKREEALQEEDNQVKVNIKDDNKAKEEEVEKSSAKEDTSLEKDVDNTSNNKQDCKELEEKVKELEERILRDAADFENLKKRYEKEKAQAIAYAHESFARDLLSVIDSLDSAAALDVDEENLKESLQKIKEGIDLTVDQFKKVFKKHGIELIDIEDGFDPNFHEAVMQVDSDKHQKGDIVQVFQKGYKIKDRVLRPAMVSISK